MTDHPTADEARTSSKKKPSASDRSISTLDLIKGTMYLPDTKTGTKDVVLAGVVHLHDLRHSYAAMAIAAGQDIRIVGAQLGHTQIQTTMRYAHVAIDPLRRATNQVSGVIAALATGRAEADEPSDLG